MNKIFLLLFLFFISCNNNSKIDDDIMTIDEMVEFLFDVNLINTSRGFTNINKNNYFLIRDTMLFKKHEIDCLKFVKIYEGIDAKTSAIIDSINNIKE